MDRISKLKDAHPWLTEDQARLLLLIKYFEITRTKGEAMPEAQDHAMDAWTMRLMNSDTERLKVIFDSEQPFALENLRGAEGDFCLSG